MGSRPSRRIIIDAYTDEPAGLGVPPFLGVYPRYAAGHYGGDAAYLTVDDLRYAKVKRKRPYAKLDPATGKTRIDLINHTREPDEVARLLAKAKELVVIIGVQTPGKYLSGVPGTYAEVMKLLDGVRARKVLGGPIVTCGTQVRGGARAEVPDLARFARVEPCFFSDYADLRGKAIAGACVLDQIPAPRLLEIETGRGCPRREGCSFCTEPLKHQVEWRDQQDVHDEVAALWAAGARHFRLGKQSCIFSYKSGALDELEALLAPLAARGPEVLHVDNVNPAMVTQPRAELFARYCTPGSTAAFGVESFDPRVAEANNLNATPKVTMDAVRVLNKVGAHRGANGLPAFLPGINLLLGLAEETPETLEANLAGLMQILEEGLMVRRTNIRQVVAFPGTRLYETTGNRVARKHRRLYGPWTDRVRREFDVPMLRRVFPQGAVLRDLRAETHEGNVTFLRHLGSYPVVVGVRERLPLGEWFDVRVVDHMLRSVVGERV